MPSRATKTVVSLSAIVLLLALGLGVVVDDRTSTLMPRALTRLTQLAQTLSPSRTLATASHSAMKVTVVPCRQDNYQYIVTDPTSGVSAAIDAYDPDKLEAAAKKEGVKLGKLLLSTHHHNDHSGGNLEFLKRFPEAQSYAGSEKSPGTQTIVRALSSSGPLPTELTCAA